MGSFLGHQDPKLERKLRNIECAETGDILLFSGRGLFAASVRTVTISKWSHVGIAIWVTRTESLSIAGTTPIVERSTVPILCVFDTNVEAKKDLITDRYVAGCRLIPLRDILKDYYTIAVRKIKPPRD